MEVESHEDCLSWLTRIFSEGSLDWESCAICDDWRPPHRRIVRALSQDAQDLCSVGDRDLVALFRAVLLHERERLPKLRFVRLPKRLMDISSEVWKESGILCESTSNGGGVFRVNPWSPDWIDGESHHAVDDTLNSRAYRHQDSSISGDLFLHRFGFGTYRSTAQRDALRSILFAEPGSTVIVNLPTGSGKSLCAFLPSTIPPSESSPLGVTPIIVPTVALGLDLNRRISQLTGHNCALRTEPDAFEESTAICDRVRSGEQGPVLTSPESALGRLREPLKQAARAGMLRYFVVDEAHMINAWGDEFRPAFQQLAGFRRELQALTPPGHPFVTVLMSGTFTEYNLDTLAKLFAEDAIRYVHAPRLRPEPSWWMSYCSSEELRIQRVLEAIRHLPRPLILYVTKRDDAAKWRHILLKAGYHRVGMMSGDTGPTERRELLQKWQDDEIDVMVGTSAFGLGVDKPDVRAVIHATLPEGVDRFYQEVGRAGRDGRESVSILLRTAKDWTVAGGLLNTTYISGDRGRQRWLRMFQSPKKQPVAPNEYLIPITVPPSHDSGDIDMDSDANRLWNLRTVLLMARARLVEVTDPEWPESIRNEPRSDWLGVRILDPDHDAEKTWFTQFASCRDRLQDANRETKELLERFLRAGERGDSCMASVLKDCYTSKCHGVHPAISCGGCPSCRRHNAEPTSGVLRVRSIPALPLPTVPPDADGIKFLEYHRRKLITVPTWSDETWESVREFVCWALNRGFTSLLAPQRFIDNLRDESHRRPHWKTTIHNKVPRPTDAVALQPLVAVVHGEVESEWPAVWSLIQDESRWIIAIISKHTRQPDHPGRLASDALPGSCECSMEYWLENYLE